MIRLCSRVLITTDVWARGIDVQQVSLVTWYRRTAGLSCHVVSTYSRSLLSRGIDVQQVSLVTWYRRTAGLSCHVVSTYSRSLLSSTMTCQITGSCISTGERDVFGCAFLCPATLCSVYMFMLQTVFICQATLSY